MMTSRQARQVLGCTIELTDVYGDSSTLHITRLDRWHVYGTDRTGHEAKIDRTDIASFTK